MGLEASVVVVFRGRDGFEGDIVHEGQVSGFPFLLYTEE